MGLSGPKSPVILASLSLQLEGGIGGSTFHEPGYARCDGPRPGILHTSPARKRSNTS